MEIVQYQPEAAAAKQDRAAFERLNRAWIEKYFCIEKEDIEVFENLDAYVKNGAGVFFAKDGETYLAACMTVPVSIGSNGAAEGKNEWEICKLAAAEDQKRRGAGSAVFEACKNYALSRGATRIILLTNTRLKPALHIYEKYGFKVAPLETWNNFSRADVEYEFKP